MIEIVEGFLFNFWIVLLCYYLILFIYMYIYIVICVVVVLFFIRCEFINICVQWNMVGWMVEIWIDLFGIIWLML